MTLTVVPVQGIPEITEGADLAGMIAEAATGLADGDILVITSKIVSKAEGRVARVDREQAIDAESVRVVARRGPTRIVETRQGLVLAAAGVDASNTPPGTVVLLPEDPDGCNEFEGALLKDLEITHKYMQRVMGKSDDRRLKTRAFHAQANLLTAGILSKARAFFETLRRLHDRSGQAQGDISAAPGGDEPARDCTPIRNQP